MLEISFFFPSKCIDFAAVVFHQLTLLKEEGGKDFESRGLCICVQSGSRQEEKEWRVIRCIVYI